MSKLNSQSDQVILKAVSELQGAELKVFLAWFTDSVDFNAPQTEIQKRTGLTSPTISNAFKKLKEIDYLEQTGRVKRSVNYKLTDSFLKSINTNHPVPTSGSNTKPVLSNPNHQDKQEKEVKESSMDKITKVYNAWKTDNPKKRYGKDEVTDLVGVVVANGATEDELESFGKKFKKEAARFIDGLKTKTKSEKESWKVDVESFFDMAQAEHFKGDIILEAVAPAISPEDQEAIHTGFESAAQKRAYLSSFKKLDVDKIPGRIMENFDVTVDLSMDEGF